MRQRLARVQWDRWRLPFIGVAVLLIVVAPAMLRQSLQDRTLAAADWVAHTRLIQAEIATMNLELREVEQSSLLISLGVQLPRLRERVEGSGRKVGPMIERIVELTRDNPRQQVRLGQLKEVIERRLAISRELLAAPSAERRAALANELANKYPIRPLMVEILGNEQALVQQRLEEAALSRRQANWVGWGSLVVQLLLLTAVTAVLARQIAERLRAEKSASRASARSSAVLQTVRDPIVLLDGARRIVLRNAAFSELYDIGEDEDGVPLEAVGDGAWQDAVVLQRLTDVLLRGRELWDYEHQQTTAGGVSRTVLLNARRMPLPDTEDEAVLLTVSDITAQKVAQQQIINLNRQLEGKVEQVSDVNRELEAFSYSVSHDLRAPLRHISGFSDKLARHLGDAADEKSRHYMQVIGDSAKRMSNLIDDLLVYSRLGRSALRLQAVDMQSLVSETRAMLDANVKAEKNTLPLRVDWHVAPLPILVADENMMRQVWQNLLGNAVKYSGKREVAVVEIDHVLDADGSHHFTVKDNGAGFDMAYAGRLFGVFQRLHRASEYAGTGIGLASVRRVLGRHGGKIWAESEVDRGATFHFTLPPTQDASLIPSHDDE
ncbi:sensor histidine kinase [Pseudoxanthomonas composti]|uniref:histidine kinase n=1 Tax=Pseudoxanthomonas composti TaxID=2137479 RepID=A0A4V1N138_9GAMM|nr:ATP-binding protein [Pseudoxanthomonas composti]RXR05914.1 histidine kinase [Pseudoxanthomonas composti]